MRSEDDGCFWYKSEWTRSSYQGPLLTSTDKWASSALGMCFPPRLHWNAKPGSCDLCTSGSGWDSSFLSDFLIGWLTLIPLPSGFSQCIEHHSQSPTTLELQEPDSCSVLPTPSVSHGGLWTSLPTSARNLGVGTSYWDSLKHGEMEEWPHFPEPSLLIHRKTLVFSLPNFSLHCSWWLILFPATVSGKH